MIAATFLILLGGYLTFGLAFAIPFALFGVKRIDPHATEGSWGFRMLIIPGTMAFWPLLLRRWATGVQDLPEECNAHRLNAKCRVKNEKCGVSDPKVRNILHSALCIFHFL